MRSFPVSRVSRGTKRLPGTSFADSLSARAGSAIEAGASNLGGLVECAGHPFLNAAHLAFSEHLPLVLSPDDVWLCLVQGLGIHVNLHAEALRTKWVTHAGKLEIAVRRDEFVRGAPGNDWEGVFSEFSDALAKSLGRTRDLVVADHSTTGAIERAAFQIVLMHAVERYFDFRLITRCGIPSITLLGSVEDWRSIRRRVGDFAEFGLEPWVRALIPVLDQFVAASSGSVKSRFWRSFYKLNELSGGPYVTGWINVFFPYVVEPESFGVEGDVVDRARGIARSGRPKTNTYAENWARADGYGNGPRTDRFPRGLSRAPFVWEYLGARIPMELVAGFVGLSQDAATLAVRPAIGWAVRESA